jgi:hypothetical protein
MHGPLHFEENRKKDKEQNAPFHRRHRRHRWRLTAASWVALRTSFELHSQRTMPRTRGPVWAHFTEIVDHDQDYTTDEAKSRIKYTFDSAARLSCFEKRIKS